MGATGDGFMGWDGLAVEVEIEFELVEKIVSF